MKRKLSILSIRFRWYIKAKQDNFMLKLARIMPKRLKYFVVVVLFGEATMGKYSDTVCSELTVFELQKRIFS